MRFIILTFCLFHCWASDSYFLTTPHSGTHLTYCYVQALTGKPVHRINEDLSYFEVNPLKVDLDRSKKPLVRSHHGSLLSRFNQNGNKLLFVLRNYKETMYRNAVLDQVIEQEFKELFLRNHPKFDLYIDNLRVFDRWDPSQRLLVYYEDLITNPEREVVKILEFLEEPSRETLTTERIHEISSDVLAFYHERFARSGGSHTKGKAVKYHSANISPSVLQEIDALVARQFPDLWSKYLFRF